MKLGDVIKRPIITEKSARLPAGEGRYSFEVNIQTDKSQIKKAVENLFKVTVVGIQTVIVKGKNRKMLKTRKEIKLPNWKKATVQLKPGEKIEIFETGE